MIHYLHDAAGPLCSGLSAERLPEIEEVTVRRRLDLADTDADQGAAGLAAAIQRSQRAYTQRFHEGVAKAAHAEASFKNGRDLAEVLGYDRQGLDALPPLVVDTFVGLGNPFAAGPARAGERIVDVGCGAGFDVVCCASQVGPQGLVVGVDITHAMVARTGRAAALSDLDNVVVVQGTMEELPLSDGWADRVISNGVLNLGDRERAVAEILRVLKPRGRVQFVDTAYGPDVAPNEQSALDLFNSVRDRRLTCPDWRQLLESAGFADVVVGPEFDPYVDRHRRTQHRPRLFSAMRPG